MRYGILLSKLSKLKILRIYANVRYFIFVLKIVLVTMFITLRCVAQSLIDSSNTPRIYLNASASASYAGESNWSNRTGNSLAIAGGIDLNYDHVGKHKWNEHHLFRTELGFIRYGDSIWIKNSDAFKIQMRWSKLNEKKFETLWSFYLGSQWLNDYDYSFVDNETKKRWTGGIFNPLSIELIYGWNKELWKSSRVSVSLATIKIESLPINKAINTELKKDESLLITKHSYIKALYGFSSQFIVNESMYNDAIMLRHESRFFFNGLSRTSVHLDINNRIAFNFLKFMQLRLDTKILFDPDYSTKLQFRQEVLLGVFYQHQNRKQ